MTLAGEREELFVLTVSEQKVPIELLDVQRIEEEHQQTDTLAYIDLSSLNIRSFDHPQNIHGVVELNLVSNLLSFHNWTELSNLIARFPKMETIVLSHNSISPIPEIAHSLARSFSSISR